MFCCVFLFLLNFVPVDQEEYIEIVLDSDASENELQHELLESKSTSTKVMKKSLLRRLFSRLRSSSFRRESSETQDDLGASELTPLLHDNRL